MSVHDLAAEDLAAQAADDSDLGEELSYSAEGASEPFVIFGIVGSGNQVEPRFQPSGVMGDGDIITVRVVRTIVETAIDDATGTERLPGGGDTFTLRGDTYGVVSARPTAGGGCQITAERRRITGIGPAEVAP